jgi:REP element-mobilizing transposase RayT
MPFIRIWIHAVWSTKNREPLLTAEIRKRIFEHILTNAKSKDIFINEINGYVDHIHCLISLGSEQTISKVIQLIKGESSFWINKSGLTTQKFEWQDEYFTVSVSESQVEKVRD